MHLKTEPGNFTAYKASFKAAFLAGIEAHLGSPEDTRPEAKSNQAFNVIKNSGKAPGDFSRILDEFAIPLPSSYQQFKQYVQEQGCIGKYMQSLIEELLPEVLNEDRTALKQSLIDAINQQDGKNYENMLKAAGNEPQEIAKIFIQAIVIGYSQRMFDTLDETEQLSWFGNEAVEFAFIADYVTLDGLKASVQEPITFEPKQLAASIDKLMEIYASGENHPISGNLDRAEEFLNGEIKNPIKALEAYLRAVKLALEDRHWQKLSPEQRQSLDQILAEDVFLAKYVYFDESFAHLDKIKTSDPTVKQAVDHLLSTVKRLKENGEISMTDLPRITKYLNDTSTLINNPDDQKAWDKHDANIKEALGKNRSWGPVVGGALLCVAGVLLAAAAIAITVLTFGVSSPLTLPTAVAGGAMAASGMAITAGAAAGLAVTAGTGIGVAAKMGLFARSAAKGPIANAMEEVRTNIKKTQEMKEGLAEKKEEREAKESQIDPAP